MTYEQFQEKFQIKLNRQQAEAVRSIEGPVLLLAVPGSGKTTVLVTRLGYMVICAGVLPEHILTITYSVSAARDMEKRFCACFGHDLGGRLEFRTINGICTKIIQYYGKLIGKKPFSLVTENETITGMLSEIFLQTEGSYATESDLKEVISEITYIKNSMLTGDEIRQRDRETGYRISGIYQEYGRRLHARGLMDYDDQMVYAYNILRKSPETLWYFQNRYNYICVDEAQDTSRIQHEVIRLLAGGRDNLFMVGDEDQSIYGFRAAYPEALLSFEREHPGAKILVMEENFRSDGKIVAAADRFIQKNTLRHEKHMTSARAAETEIQRIALKGRKDQYHYLAGMAEECQAQTAVLYRNNESALPLVDLLERRGIPYRLRSAELTFFTHRIVQDIRNIIGFASDPRNTDLFLQIYYKISTYIGKRDALSICEISRQENRDVLEAAINYEGLPERTRKSCRVIRTHLNYMLSERADAAVNRIMYYMGYENYLERMGMNDGKLSVLKAIAQNEPSPGRLVDRLEELQAILREKQEDAAHGFTGPGDLSRNVMPVILSTIHSSKGLEYDTVYLMDVIDGVFPETVPENMGAMDPKQRAAYEEERRLFYVGVTRARNRLFVFRLEQRSSFCEELCAPVRLPKKRPFSRKEFEKFLSAIGDGLIVKHRKLGDGVVVEVQGERAVIQFGDEQKLFALKALYEYDLLVF